MKNQFGLLLFLATQMAAISCGLPPKQVVYGSNNGKSISVLNKNIYYEEYGHGTPLLLLSGGGISRSIKDFENCIPDLAKHYRVIAPDTPGQGRSEQIDSMNYKNLTEHMSVFLDALKLDSAYVMGWSDGGIVGLLLAAKRKDKIKKVIAVGANNGLRGALPSDVDISEVKPMSIEAWQKNNKQVIDNYMKLLPRDWKKLVNDLNAMWYQHEDYFSRSVYDSIKIPAMIVLGDRDEIAIEHGLEMHRLIKHSEFCVLPNTSHNVFSERPDLINKIALDFFISSRK